MQSNEGITPQDPNSLIVDGQRQTILCTLGITEWYGEADWPDVQAYDFVDFIIDDTQLYRDMKDQVQLIAVDESQRISAGIDPQCSNWESGDNDGILSCSYKWGNFSLWNQGDSPLIQARRLNNWTINRSDSMAGNTTNYNNLLTSNTYKSTANHNDPLGVEKNLEFRFAVNGSSKTGSFSDSDFFILTIDQFATLRCTEKGTGSNRLWIMPSSDGTGYPLCRAGRPDGAIDNIVANQP